MSTLEQRRAGELTVQAPHVSIVIINKDDALIDDTLASLEVLDEVVSGAAEVVVVDASAGRLDHIRQSHPIARWFDFAPLPGRSTIPHQRNFGVERSHGEVIVFTDASCMPEPHWLPRLIAPIQSEGEQIVAGSVLATGKSSARDNTARIRAGLTYVDEAPTLNFAMTRHVHAEIGGFDETFGYGSDVDFTWRAVDAGYRIRYVPDSTVWHDWGSTRSEMRRSYTYGRARARLYLKHKARWRDLFGRDVVSVIYPIYLLSLPLALKRRLRWLPLTLAVPFARNLRMHPVQTIVDHLLYGAGVLSEIAQSERGFGSPSPPSRRTAPERVTTPHLDKGM